MNKYAKLIVLGLCFVFPSYALASAPSGDAMEMVVFIALGIPTLIFILGTWFLSKGNSEPSQLGGELAIKTTLSRNEELITQLIMATEDEFQIVITNEEVKKCSTPNLLTDLLYSKMKKSEDGTCSSMRGLYVVRRILMEKLGVDRKEVQEETRLDAIIPRGNRSEKWRALLYSVSEGKKVYVPLERTIGAKIFMFSLIAMVFFVALLGIGSVTGAVIFSLFIWYFLLTVTSPVKEEFPSNFQKVKDLIGIVGSFDNKEWRREEVYNRIMLLVSMQTGIKEEEILPNDHFDVSSQ